MKVKLDGFRKDTKPFFNQFVLSIPTSEKQTSPFIVVTSKEVLKCNTVDKLLEFSSETEVLQTWPGKKRSDVFYFTVENLKDHMKKENEMRQSRILWCMIDTNNKVIPGIEPTATDLLELANKRLTDIDEFDCCKTDVRVKTYINIEKLLNETQTEKSEL